MRRVSLLIVALALATLAVFVVERDSSGLVAFGAEAGAVSGVVLADNGGRIVAVNADGSGIRTLTVSPSEPTDSDPVASPDGSLIAFERDFDRIKVMRADGSGLRDLGEGSSHPLEWAPDGSFLAYGSNPFGITVVRPDGSDRRLLVSDAEWFGLSWSPDGTSIAYASSDGIAVVNVRTGAHRLLFAGEQSWRPAWSPDGSQIAFLGSLGRGDDFLERVLVMNADGSGVHAVGPLPTNDTPAWSPESTQLAFGAYASEDGKQVSVAVLESSAGHVITTIPPLAGRDSRSPSWSPDGERLAFLRSGDEGDDVWVVRADGTQEVQLTRQFPIGGSSSVPGWLPGLAAVTPDRPLPLAALRAASSQQLGDRYRVAAVDRAAIALVGPRATRLGIWLGRGSVHWIETKAIFALDRVALSGRRVYWSYYAAERDGRTWSGLYTATWPGGRTVRLRYMENKPGVTVAGDRTLVVYTLGHSLWRLQGTAARRIRSENTDLWPLSVNAGHALIANRHSRLEVVDSSGKLLASLPEPKNYVSAHLSGNRVIVLSSSKIRVYRLPSGTLRSTRPVGAIGLADAAGIPYGSLFPYESEQHWHVVDLDTGHDKILTIHDRLSPLTTAITSSGLYYTAIPQYSTVEGEVGLVPLSAVRRAVR